MRPVGKDITQGVPRLLKELVDRNKGSEPRSERHQGPRGIPRITSKRQTRIRERIGSKTLQDPIQGKLRGKEENEGHGAANQPLPTEP
jgi:hypothetical protein